MSSCTSSLSTLTSCSSSATSSTSLSELTPLNTNTPRPLPPRDVRNIRQPMPRKRSTRSREIMENMSGRDILNGNYSILEQLGSGGFGVTYRAQDKTRRSRRRKPEFTAVKVQKLNCYDTSFNNKLIANEVKTLKKISGHKNVVQFCEYRRDKSYAFLVTQYYSGPTLQQDIRARRSFSNALASAKRIFLEIINGVKFLHDNGIYHCDLKPENIILDQNVRIIDFGLASNTPQRSGRYGTPDYMAPEVTDKRTQSWDCDKADVWALGVILLYMISGHRAWKEAIPSNRSYCYYIKTREHDIYCLRDLVRNLPKKLAASLSYILNPTSNHRPGLLYTEFILKNPWE